MVKMFGKRTSTIGKLMSCLIGSIVATSDDKVVGSVGNDTCTIENDLNKKKHFELYPNALYVTGIKFHHTKKPQGSQIESKSYISSKHYLYGYKVEVSVSFVEFCCAI